MTDWKRELSWLGAEVRTRLLGAAAEVAHRVGKRDPYMIAGHHGWGTERRVFVHARTLEDEGIGPSAADDSHLRNIINTYRRMESDPLPGSRVAVRVGGAERELVADEEGFVGGWIDLETALPADRRWHQVELELREPRRAEQGDVRASAEVLVPAPGAPLGVISDIDDTVIQSKVTNFLQAARTVMLGNARTRLPFPGVAAFYRALHRGAGGAADVPIFYVSSSPWNLFDLIAEFFEVQGVPRGPIMLRDWDLSQAALASSRHFAHKGAVIREILTTYPSLPFILIGDSGQHDPEIYRAIVGEFPDRILAVYIRNVTSHPERSQAIQRLAEEVKAAGSTLVLADDTLAAAQHAAEHGWIDAAALPDVRDDKRADEGTAGTKVETPGTGPADPGAPTIVVGE